MSATTGETEEGRRGGVAVVTDSTTYLPASLIERWGIQQVNLYVGWGSEHLPEQEYELDAFYARLRDSPDLPSTSQPSVGDFLACFEPLAGAGRDVVSIHIASGLSGTYESAVEAARAIAEKGLPGRIEVVDGQTGAGGLGCLCLPRREPPSRAWRWGPSSTPSTKPARGSRCGSASTRSSTCAAAGGSGGQALVGSALKIKPILTFGTEITPVGRVRTRRRAMQQMVSYLHELHDRGAADWFVQHAQSLDDAEALVAQGTEIFGKEPLFCTQVGPVLGGHLGSGMLVGGIGTRREQAA